MWHWNNTIFGICAYLTAGFANATIPDVAENYSKIAPADQIILDRFFQHLCSKGDFMHVLMGVKPMGIVTECIEWENQHMVTASNCEQLRCQMILNRKGFKIWEKYAHLFPGKRLHFSCFDEGHGFYSFALLNIQHCKDIIAQNLPLFRKKYGDLSIDTLFTKVQEGHCKEFMNSDLPSYHRMLAALLGYGSICGETFVKRDQLVSALSQFPYDIEQMPAHLRTLVAQDFHKHAYPNPLPSLSEVHEFAKTLVWAKIPQERRIPVGVTCMLSVRDNPEVLEKQKIAQSKRQEMLDFYFDPNFLLLFLERLTS